MTVSQSSDHIQGYPKKIMFDFWGLQDQDENRIVQNPVHQWQRQSVYDPLQALSPGTFHDDQAEFHGGF